MQLFLAHSEADGTLATAALEALAATMQLSEALGVPFTVGLIGDNPGPAADSLTACGAARILTVSGPAFGQARYATDAAAAEVLCRAAGASIITVPATSRWNRVLPGVAHRLGGRCDTHVTGLGAADGQPQVSRWFYRQRMEAVFTRRTRPWLLALEGGIATAAALGNRQAQGPAPIESIPLTLDAPRTQVTGFEAPAADQQTIRPDANLLFVTGAGWTKKQADGQVKVAAAEALILDFLRLSRASLGSTKSLVDLGGEGQAILPFLSHLNQVGQTGATPRHAKGLATCCHGEEPHTVGWRFIGERRAISLDANCGWARGKADILYVADAFAVLGKVNELLAQ
ncbi:MAG: electron transfer flavoprotein subunit alpha [Verrucomicrobia bacterium]|nr:electron transfer flavoprotein subunit alpha [Verrucomicrobiota bacterium]